MRVYGRWIRTLIRACKDESLLLTKVCAHSLHSPAGSDKRKPSWGSTYESPTGARLDLLRVWLVTAV